MKSTQVSYQIASNLRMYRERAGYSQKQVADLLEIDRSTYTYYELAKTTPSIATVMKLARLFEIDCTDLLATEGHEPPPALHDIAYPTFQFHDLPNEEISLLLAYRDLPEDVQKKLISALQEVSCSVNSDSPKTLEIRVCDAYAPDEPEE